MTHSNSQENASANTGRRTGSFDLYSAITSQIIDMLQKGVVPWRSPILGQSKAGWPKNLESTRQYRGVNVFLLAFTAFLKGYGSSYWLTFNQAKMRGGAIKRGEKSTVVVFWKKLQVTDKETGEKKDVPMLRYYRVFNAEQCEGVKAPDAITYTPTPFEAIKAAERVLQGYKDGPIIEHGGQRAFYLPAIDKVAIPEPGRFTSNSEYYSTLFHELSHSTGVKKRLDRGVDTKLAPFGSPDYGKEELIAEMSAAFLCGHTGISPSVIDNQAAYISGWLGRLKQDKKLIIQAAGAAQRSADWILGQRGGQTADEPDEPEEQAATQSPPSSASLPSVAPALAAPAFPPLAFSSERHKELTDAAKDYIRREYSVVPIAAGEKAPCIKRWLELKLTEHNVSHAFERAGNIGIILGEQSGHLVDVDLDCPEARELADKFLPPTDTITGRPGSPRSHRWYRCRNIQTVRHRDPVDKSSIVELRGIGSQTLVGPSIHPCGEQYDFLTGEPATVDPEQLKQAVSHLAAEVIRMRHGELPSPQPTAYACDLLSPVTVQTDPDQLHRRAAAYLGAMPPAICGQGGHNLTYAAATALVHGFGLSEPEAFELLKTEYNPRCRPQWSEKELQHKVRDAMNRPHQRPRGWLLVDTQ